MKRTIESLDVKNKRVLLRVDFNVPMEDGFITDTTRIERELPTIKYLLTKGAKLIICSHLGRPKGKVVESMSLMPVAKVLVELLPLTKIRFANDCIGKDAKTMAENLKAGEILLLENLRFYPGEEKNDPFFAKELASLAEIYVNDAFGTSHRNHASIVGVAKLLPNAVGFLMGQEVNTILDVLDNPTRPFVAILGGSKVSDKIYVVMNLISKVNAVLIGGGMAYTFLKAKGISIGKSLVDDEKVELARNILDEAEKRGISVFLPIDHLCAEALTPNAKVRKVKTSEIPDELMALDIGPKTVKLFSNVIKKSKTVIWNGPMGVFEFPKFAKGTEKIAKAVSKVQGKTVVGGGDSIAAIRELKLENKIYHISTGGGASLKLLEGEVLPGVEVIEDVK